MRLKHIGIAAVIVAGGLMAAFPWGEVDRTGVFDQVAQHSRTDVDTNGTGRFDPYSQGHRAGWVDPYTEGMGHPVIDLVWIQRNT